jgi:hypothetical protein
MGSFLKVTRWIAALAWLAAGPLAAAPGDLFDAIEYYYAARDHYFVTALPLEIAALDGGQIPGWQRTGLSFKVYDPTTALAGLYPVCRFYGLPQAGLDSHFYSAFMSECDYVKQRFPNIWIFESDDVFLVALPDLGTGQCPAGTVPIYRAWNNRPDSNHRYTTDPLVLQAMVARGYIAEGYGPPPLPVAMCSPMATGTAPSCALVASDTAPAVGVAIKLTALCSGSPTQYVWTGCVSSSATCSTTSAVAGVLNYSVVASNPSGSGPPATVSVDWMPAPAPPMCAVAATTDNPQPEAGSLAMLDAECTGNPTSFTWTGCSSAISICLTRVASPGPKAYTVTATNAGGTSAPATTTINWQAAPGPLPGLCSQFPNILYTDGTWAESAIHTTYFSDNPAFAWNGAWVYKFTLPPDAGGGGRVTVSEFNGPPTTRDSTLSSVPCDFRPTDPTGVNGPLSRSNGTTTTNNFIVGPGVSQLTPGATYYLSVRNWDIDSKTISCSAAQQRCDALLYFVP